MTIGDNMRDAMATVFEATKARAVALCEKMARSGQKHGASKEFVAGAYAAAEIVRDMTEEER